MAFSAAISLYYQLASQGAAFTSFKLSLLTLASPQRALFFYLFFLLAFSCLYACCSASENGFAYSFTLILSIAISCISCSRIYFATVASFNPTVLTYYPSLQKCLFPNLYFRFAFLSNIINADFPFRYPINADTDNDGGIITSICT